MTGQTGALPRRPTAIQRWLATDAAFAGIGIARAARLADAFGDGLHAALRDRDPRVSGILPPDVAERLLDAYADKARVAAVADELTRLDADAGVALKLLRLWPEDALERLRANPFLLVSWVGWRKTEEIGRLLGVSADDPRRLVAAVEAALYGRLDSKHTATKRDELQRLVSRMVGDGQADAAIDLAVADAGCVPFSDGRLQPPGAAAMEAFVAAEIARLLEPAAQLDLIVRDVDVRRALDALERFEADQPHRLTERQREAVALALTSRVACIGGYAGSGKTTILRAVCTLADGLGRVLHLMALSGRAARRMAEATGRQASTIARFLMARRDEPLGPEAVVVIDEASMLDLPTLYRILLDLGDARLLLVGDPAQLAPIGFGLTYHVLVRSPAVPTVVLDRVHRQDEASGIPAVAAAIRCGRMPDLADFDGRRPGVSFVDCDADDAIRRIAEIGRALVAAGAVRGETQILSPMRAGAAGISAINRAFHQARAGDRPRFPGRSDIAVGDPVIFMKNDDTLDLQNGSMGRLIDVQNSTAVVRFDDRDVELTVAHAQMIDLAYAISVHKAQGSSWPRLILPVYRSRLLDRTLVYTAVTRAQSQVVLIGDRHALQRALAVEHGESRETTLASRLVV